MEEEFTPHRYSTFTFVLLVVISVFFLTAHLTGYVQGLKAFLSYIVNPTPQTANQVIQATQKFSRNIGELVRIHQENVSYRQALERYAYLDGELAHEREENKRLREMVAFQLPPQMRSVVARVILREPGGWFQWIMIDRGRDDGITLNAPVLAWADGKPTALGRIVETSAHASKVVLVTNILSAVPVQVRDAGEDGLLEGQNSGRLKVDYLVLQSTTVPRGSEVITSPLSTVFPPGIRVGYVEDVSAPNSESFRTATVQPALNLNTLREVAVLVPSVRE
jgi:rod shape-determining protein MreC